MARVSQAVLEEVSVTDVHHRLSPVFNRVVREQRPTMIRRGEDERGFFLDRRIALRAFSDYDFHVSFIPEPDGAVTLLVKELKVGASGPTVYEARQRLLEQVRFFVADYVDDISFNLRLPEMADLLPRVLRLSLAVSDAELLEMLLGPRPDDEIA